MRTSSTIGCDLATEVVRRFGSVRLRVSGASMVPTIRPGDTLLVEDVVRGEVPVGEIVVFTRAGRLIVHRVVGTSRHRGRAYLVTRGDRAHREDAPVSPSDLLGRVSAIERRGKRSCPRSRRERMQRAIARLLRFSSRATSLYLWIVEPSR